MDGSMHKRAFLLTIWLLLVLTVAWSETALAQTSECSSFNQLRDDAQQKARVVRSAVENKSAQKDICALIQRYYATESAVVRFLEDHKKSCGIPAQAIRIAREKHEQTAKLRSEACSGVASADGTSEVVSLKRVESGIFLVPVEINGVLTLDFLIDSGASDVSIPGDVLSTLMRTGAVKTSDFTGSRAYIMANGTEEKNLTFTIRSLKIGRMILDNVPASAISRSVAYSSDNPFYRSLRVGRSITRLTSLCLSQNN
jgi:predicted aspartyl protease